MLKGRKQPGGRSEVAAANYAFNPIDDDLIIKHRLLTRTTTTRGEPPLKKLQKKFTALVVEAAKDDSSLPDCNRLARAFLQELSTFEIPLLKSRAVVGAHLREKESYHELHEEVDREAARAKGDIEALKGVLEESRVERRHKGECEAIRRLVAMQPPWAETQRSIGELEREIAGLEEENLAAARLLELRKKQFALLLHVVDELQTTIEEDQKNLVEEMKMATEEHKSSVEYATVGSDIMAVD